MVKDNEVRDDDSLVRLVQKQDAEAFGVLYERHFDKIYRYFAFKTGDRTEAEDLTQQVFFKAWDAIGSYKPKGLPFSSWLFRIAHNKLVDYFRSKSKTELPLGDIDAPGGSDPASVVEQVLSSEELAEACKCLPELHQEVISLRFAAGLSTAEVAKAMGKSEGAVKAMQHSALVELRRILSPD